MLLLANLHIRQIPKPTSMSKVLEIVSRVFELFLKKLIEIFIASA